MPPTPATPTPDLRHQVAAWWWLLLGGVLGLLDLPYEWELVAGTEHTPRLWLLVDLLPDYLGWPLAAWAAWQLANSLAPGTPRLALRLGAGLMALGTMRALALLVWPLLEPPWGDLVLLAGVVELQGAILTLLGLSWALRDEPVLARAWRLAAWLLATIYLLPAMLLGALMVWRFQWGEWLHLPQPLLGLLPLMACALVQWALATRLTLRWARPATARPPAVPVTANPLPLVAGAVGLMGLMLLAILLGAWLVFPRVEEPPGQQAAAGGATPGQQPSPWERDLQLHRPLPERPRDAQAGQNHASGGPEEGQGDPVAGGQLLNPDHLALRETADAQLILFLHFGLSEEAAMATLEKVPVRGPFRDFELARLRARLDLHKFDANTQNRQNLAAFQRSALRLIESPYANFEDRFYAGVAQLFSGELAPALTLLEQARREWPARGSSYGMVYHLHLAAHAADGNLSATLEMLADYRENYPDWLYLETILPDFDQLQRVYPDRPLLHLVRGRLLQHTLDDRGAREQYLLAQRVGGSRQLRQTLSEWLAEVQPMGGL